MSNKFVAFQTVIDADWLNSVDQLVWGLFGGHSDPGYILSAIGAPNVSDVYHKTESDAKYLVDAPVNANQYARKDGAWAVVNTRMKGVYRLYEDFGTESDERPWLRAMSSMQPGEVLLLRPDATWTIGQPLVFMQNGLSIVNPFGRRDYHCILRPGDPNLKLLTFGCSGGVIKGLNFWGLQSEIDTSHTPEGSYGTCDGLILDRTSMNLGARGADLDMRIEDCGFYGLRDLITFYGRNVTIRDCSFDQCRNLIKGIIYTYSGGIKTQMRGIKIHDNVMHNVGFRMTDMLDVMTPTNCISIPTDDTTTEGDKTVNSVEVYNNYTYKCHTFYRGPISSCRIQNNQCQIATGPLAIINDGGTGITSENVPGVISGNIWWGHADSGAEILYNARNAIAGDSIHNLKLADNYLFQSSEALIKLTNVYNLHMAGDTLAYANMGYARAGSIDSAAIEIGAVGGGGYQGVQLDGIRVQGNNYGPGVHTYAIRITSHGEFVTINGGQLTAGRSGLIDYVGNPPAYYTYDNTGRVHTNLFDKGNHILLGKVTLDGQLMVTGIGEAEAYGGAIVYTDVPCAVTVAAKEVVYLNSTGKWALAKADTMATCGYLGMVMVGASAGGYPVVCHSGPVKHSGFTTMINPGAPLWLSDATAGTITWTQPGTAGRIIQLVGYLGVNRDSIIMDPGPPRII